MEKYKFLLIACAMKCIQDARLSSTIAEQEKMTDADWIEFREWLETAVI